jgi:succinyl-CoA synthetase beta subunit
MVRLSESQSKSLLAEQRIDVPEGLVVTSPEEARRAAAGDAGVVVKAQVSVTGRRDRGLIRFATGSEEAQLAARDLLNRTVSGTRVMELRVEDRVAFEDEWYAGITIDTAARRPKLLFSTEGGTGIETVTEERPDTVTSRHLTPGKPLRPYEAYDFVRRLGLQGDRLRAAGGVITALTKIFTAYDARSVEINPVVWTGSDAVAVDARVTVDDAAAGRHEELDIDIAREFGRRPTDLERIAYRVEEYDYRGTFYFIQTELEVEQVARSDGYVGFHGAGGGGSMMSLDAVSSSGLRAPNYTDTSGNPPVSKVYKAARIIMSQPGIQGYLYSGSGAASQEMYITARGLMRAFIDEHLTVPVVLRLGGNAEDRAIDIVERYRHRVPATVEAYGGARSAKECADRLAELVGQPPTERDELDRRAADGHKPDIDGDLRIEGLEAYRTRVKELEAVAELTEDPTKWVF